MLKETTYYKETPKEVSSGDNHFKTYIAVMKTVQPGPPNIAHLNLDRVCLNMVAHNKISAMVNNYWKYAPSFEPRRWSYHLTI